MMNLGSSKCQLDEKIDAPSRKNTDVTASCISESNETVQCADIHSDGLISLVSTWVFKTLF